MFNISTYKFKIRYLCVCAFLLMQVSGDKAQLINYPARQHKDGLITSVLGLRFALHAHHFRGGDSMRVKCVASVSPAVVENLPVRDLREALLLGECASRIKTIAVHCRAK